MGFASLLSISIVLLGNDLPNKALAVAAWFI
jgi:hypothetical protein